MGFLGSLVNSLRLLLFRISNNLEELMNLELFDTVTTIVTSCFPPDTANV